MRKRYIAVSVGPEMGFNKAWFKVSYSMEEGGMPILNKVMMCISPKVDPNLRVHPRFIVSIKAALQAAITKQKSDGI